MRHTVHKDLQSNKVDIFILTFIMWSDLGEEGSIPPPQLSEETLSRETQSVRFVLKTFKDTHSVWLTHIHISFI